MVNILMVIGVSSLIFILGGGIGYLIWLKTRPKKETWSAKVYQLGEGTRINEISKIKLNDLRPYARDVLEKIHKGVGITVYRLQKLNKTTPAVEGDLVEYWGDGKREVSVLYHQGECTLLKFGYDQTTGEKIFKPISSSKINLIKGEIAIQKERLQKEKDILQAITPWIVAGITVIGLVAITYIMISGFITISEHQEDAAENYAKLTNAYNAKYNEIEDLKKGVEADDHDLGVQNQTIT